MPVNPHSTRSRALALRILGWLLRPGHGEVQAMQQALQLRGVLRFIAVFAATIVLPSLLLAYFGATSIRSEERTVMVEVERQAETVADGFWTGVDRAFSGFESEVRNRLEAGRSPLESPKQLHPELLVAFRLDADLELTAPFKRSERLPVDPVTFVFDPIRSRAVQAERSGEDRASVARMYARAARSARGRAARARARFDRARVLADAGRTSEALNEFGELSKLEVGIRDSWGFRIADLARLRAAELHLQGDTEAGAAELRRLVNDLNAVRWTIGEGGEAAIARRALSRLGAYADAEWAAGARSRVAERSARLFWASELVGELDQILSGPPALRVDKGKLRWGRGKRGLWATTWWGEDLYAFALDLDAVIAQLRAQAGDLVQPGSAVVPTLVGPDDVERSNVLVRRSIAPWLTGWALVVSPRDPAALAATQNRKRTQRIGIILIAVAMIGVGAFLSARLVSRELDVARMKADFAANVSHELRSPITQIRLKAESLLFGLSDTTEERERDYRTIVRESERLSRLVDNVLDFAAIERGTKRYRLVPGDLSDSIRGALDSIESSPELESMALEVDLPDDLPPVRHDADGVAQCVINLVSNAAKYSEPGGWIGVRAVMKEDAVEVSVSDRGIGVAAKDLKQIFEPFYRSSAPRSRRRKGTGLGLAITWYIMEAHGGRVRVQSVEGHGSTFSLLFPLASQRSGYHPEQPQLGEL